MESFRGCDGARLGPLSFTRLCGLAGGQFCLWPTHSRVTPTALCFKESAILPRKLLERLASTHSENSPLP